MTMYAPPRRWAAYGREVKLYENCIFLRPEVIALGDGVRVDAMVKVEGGRGVTVGKHVHIASFCHINAGGGLVELGAHSGYASHVVICGGQTDYTMGGVTPQDGNVPRRFRTVIGEYTVVFAGAVVLPGVTVGRRCVVAAGAVVTKNVPDYAIMAGVPARVVGDLKCEV